MRLWIMPSGALAFRQGTRLIATTNGGKFMEDWSTLPDERVFGSPSEMPGSQASYWREIEIQRRLYGLQRDLLGAQLAAVATQQAAIAEMKTQSNQMFWSTIGVFLTALITLGIAIVQQWPSS